ncbi:DUF3618 domain-containing protein [Streptomyces sp. NPDC002643]
MTHTTDTTRTSGTSPAPTGAKGPDELRQQIAETRARLGDTVEELAAKADVKGRAQARMRSARERVPRRAVVVGATGVTVVTAVVAGVLVWRHYR